MKVKIYNYDMMQPSDSGFFIDNKGMDLQHLRYVDGNVVNITRLKKFYIEKKDGVYLLHAAKFPGTQEVKMSFKDRRKLYTDRVGNYKIKTDVEIHNENTREFRKSRYPDIGDQIGAIMKYLETKNDLSDELKELINIINTTKNKFKKVAEIN